MDRKKVWDCLVHLVGSTKKQIETNGPSALVMQYEVFCLQVTRDMSLCDIWSVS